MERCVHKYLYNYIVTNRFISPYQSGCMKGDSTVNQLMFFYNEVCQALDEGNEVRTVFCDSSKAFDRVWHRGLIHKLSSNAYLPTTLVCMWMLIHQSYLLAFWILIFELYLIGPKLGLLLSILPRQSPWYSPERKTSHNIHTTGERYSHHHSKVSLTYWSLLFRRREVEYTYLIHG